MIRKVIKRSLVTIGVVSLVYATAALFFYHTHDLAVAVMAGMILAVAAVDTHLRQVTRDHTARMASRHA